MIASFIITLLGVLYYYSQTLIEIIDIESSPLNTLIAGAIPAMAAGLFLWLLCLALTGIEDVTNIESDDSQCNECLTSKLSPEVGDPAKATISSLNTC